MHIIIKVNFLMLEWIVNVDLGASDAPSGKKRYLGLRQLAFCFTEISLSRSLARSLALGQKQDSH